MAWERRGGQRYYYRGERIGGSVVKTYLGGGAAGERAEQQDIEARLEQRSAELRWLSQWARASELRSQLREIYEYAKTIEKSVLVANGMYIHGVELRHRKRTHE